MMSYRFKRRSFMQGVGGALGLKIMLRNLEAGAEGAKSPPRLLVTHWRRHWVQGRFRSHDGKYRLGQLEAFCGRGIVG
jgi:hypothetical protein